MTSVVSRPVADIDRLDHYDCGKPGEDRAGRQPRREGRAVLVLGRAEENRISSRIQTRRCCKLRSRSRPESEARRLGFVDMERLRIEARRETLDVVGSERVAAEIADLTDRMSSRTSDSRPRERMRPGGD